MLSTLNLLPAFVLTTIVTLGFLTGCEGRDPEPQASSSSAAAHDDHGHDHGPSGEHVTSKAGHGGAVIALGEQAIGAFSAKATRDEGDIVAGKDAPIDVTITGVADPAAKPAAVRFWIGTEDAKGSVKAKAEVEDPTDPNRWHVHAEIPNPLPAGSKLWVEIEDEAGATTVGSFDLQA